MTQPPTEPATPTVEPAVGPAIEPPPPAIDPYLLSARDYLRRALGKGVELDGSETSLAFVDHYLNAQRPSTADGAAALGDDLVKLLASALGVYFGEVVRTTLGGRWRALGDDPLLWRVELEPAGVSFSPVAMAATALYSDEVDGYDAAVKPPVKWQNAIAKVLDEAQPLEHDYFYSLTGRLESLAQMCELLADFERLTLPPEAAPAEEDPDADAEPTAVDPPH